MATKIEVRRGPDANRAFTLVGAEVRIGRGPGSHIQLTDPGMTGRLTVECCNGAYQVVNEMPTAVYLDGDVFPRSARRTWFHGHPLQPTADTELVLVIDESTLRDAGRAPVLEEQAWPGPAGRRKAVQLAATGVCVVLAVVLLVLPSGKGPISSAPQAEYDHIFSDLQRLGLTGVGDLLSDAFYGERRSPRVSCNLYVKLRAEVEALLSDNTESGTPGEKTEVLRRTLSFVNQRLTELDRHRVRPGPFRGGRYGTAS